MRLAAAVVAALALLAGCGSAGPTPTASPAPIATPSARISATAAAIAVDPSLLDVLPESVDGVPLDFSAEASADVAADQSLSGALDAVAYAIAPSPASEDLLVVSLGRLREGVFGDPFFRSWRDAYDLEVCGQAGGVQGHAEAEIGGRNVFIGSCVNGGNTYHVWLEDRRTVLSAVSFGDRRLGERLMNEIRE